MLRFFRTRKHVLGFDDRWFMLLGIPFVALLINTLLFGQLLQNDAYQAFGQCYWIAIYFTAIYWLCFRELYYILVKKFPHNDDLRKRQGITFVLILLGYFLIDFVGGIVLNTVMGAEKGDHIEPHLLLKLITTLVFSVLLVTVYESVYLSTQLGKSLLEKERLNKENIKSQLAGLRSHINPHFLFNSLNTLSALLHSDVKRADQFVAKLSKVYRYMLDTNDESLVTLSDELNYLRAYVHLLKDRFRDNIHFTENIAKTDLGYYIIPLSLQITFENAIKHNIATKEQPLMVTLYVEDGYLFMHNSLQKVKIPPESTEVGLANIKQRYSFFTKREVKIVQGDSSFLVGLPLLISRTHE